MTEPLSVLGIAGSLRAGSYNRALLRAARELAPPGIEVTPFDLRPIPMYDGDAEREGDPQPVTALKHAIRAADGLLVVTPEYNHSAQEHLRQALAFPRAHVLEEPRLCMPEAYARFDEHGRLVDQDTIEALRSLLDALRAACVPEPALA